MIEEPRHQCYKCEEELVFDVKIQRRDTCPNCDTYLHCCRNCGFWDRSAHNECREDVGEFIRDREAANFCSHYRFRTMEEDTTSETDVAKSKLDALFAAKAPADAPKPGWATPTSRDPAADARAKLDSLFKK